MKRRYDGRELREGNTFLKPCVLTKEVYNFDTKNFFTFYRIIVERIRVKSLFTPFQQLVLRLLKVTPSHLNPNAWLILVGFEYLCTHVGGLRPSPFSFSCFFQLYFKDLWRTYIPASLC